MNKPKILKNKSEAPKDSALVDTVTSSLRELCIVRNPSLKSQGDEEIEKSAKKLEKEISTMYVYFPWNKILVHMLGEEEYLELRTARNKNIIDKQEQEQYRNAYVGIIGLSVGSNVINALAFSGGPKRIKVSDFDVIETTNLNRLRAPVFAVGKNKTTFTAQQVWELDPFADLELWDQGVSKDTLEKFLIDPKLDIFIDEMDSLDLKLSARFICKENKIPVIMATDNGDNIILDVERFDKEPERPILHGLVDDINPEDIENISYENWLDIATRIVDPENLTSDMKKSLSEIGKSIASVPQLGTTATIAGAAAAYAVRKISNNQEMPSGRYVVGLDNLKKIK